MPVLQQQPGYYGNPAYLDLCILDLSFIPPFAEHVCGPCLTFMLLYQTNDLPPPKKSRCVENLPLMPF